MFLIYLASIVIYSPKFYLRSIYSRFMLLGRTLLLQKFAVRTTSFTTLTITYFHTFSFTFFLAMSLTNFCTFNYLFYLLDDKVNTADF